MRAWQALLGSMFSSKMLLHVPLVVERVLANIANPKESARFTNHFGQVVSRSQKGSSHTWNSLRYWSGRSFSNFRKQEKYTYSLLQRSIALHAFGRRLNSNYLNATYHRQKINKTIVL